MRHRSDAVRNPVREREVLMKARDLGEAILRELESPDCCLPELGIALAVAVGAIASEMQFHHRAAFYESFIRAARESEHEWDASFEAFEARRILQ